jgi:hypothetical protein
MLPWPWIDPDKALPWVEKHIGLALAQSQVAAIRLALMSKVLVMTRLPRLRYAQNDRGPRPDRRRQREKLTVKLDCTLEDDCALRVSCYVNALIVLR